jgi:hypothetical protein
MKLKYVKIKLNNIKSKFSLLFYLYKYKLN